MRRVAVAWVRRSAAIAATRAAPRSGTAISSFARDAHAAASPLGTKFTLSVIGKRVDDRPPRVRASR
jgi:hypothetical protein